MPNQINPSEYRGSAFTHEEREKRRVVGLLPPTVDTIDVQVLRVKRLFDSMSTSFQKFLVLQQIQLSDYNLFFRFLNTYPVESMPIVYTPTVGEVCQRYSEIFVKPQGMYFSRNDRGSIRRLLDNWKQPEVDIIVVTDGGRILGLGDLGLNGMGIPVGKLSLYVCGGFNPAKTLPVMLDVGTDNETLLNDPIYLGSKHKRIPDEEYYPLVEEFCLAVADKWPKCLIQFEDFATVHAFELLEKFRRRVRCFNDDIQGTGSVILAGFLNAMKAQGTNPKDVKCVFYGAGSAAVGVAQTIVSLLESLGLTNEEARRRFWLIDTKGLVCTTRPEPVQDHKVPFSRNDPPMSTLLEVIRQVKPHVLMGLAGTGPSFHKEHVEAMLETCSNPIIFPLSNPTSKSEITAIDAYTWTNGRCIFASGSPFDPVELNGKVYEPAQGNNMFIFPGVGLGAVSCGAKEVTDLMFINAAKALAGMVSPEQLANGKIYPSLSLFHEISANVAAATVETAFEQGVAGIERPENILEFCKSHMWHPSA
jgi:malic enzyme